MIGLDTGIYILEIIDNRNCILIDTIPLDSLQSLSLSINPINPSICQGSSINVSVSGALTYTWFPFINLSANIGSVVQATPSVNTVYSVVAVGANGCEDTIDVNIGVIPAPVM